jgi:small subunit ribosomal protein S6
MRTIRTYNYEAMFLLGQSATADIAGAVNHIKDVLTKNGAKIIALKKWADRPLAYPIQKQKRGMYILCYFSAPSDKMGEIENGYNLSEQVLRHLIIRADHLSLEEMQNAEGQLDLTIEANLRAAAQPTPAPAAAPAPAGA